MTAEALKPVYVIHGSDAFLRDEYRRAVVGRIVGKSDPQTVVAQFDADAELSAVLDELRTMPFLAPRRAVIVSDAEAFVSAHRESLENYLNSPAQTSSLILMVASWPKTTRLYKLVDKIGEMFDCTAPDARNLTTWLAKAAGKRGKKLAPDAVQLLIEWCGADLAVLNTELEKLSIYVGQRPIITADDAAKLVSATAGPEAFALSNAITAGDTAGAVKSLAGAMTQRGEEFKLLGLIAWHLRRAMHAQQLIQTGTPANQACKSVRIFYNQQRAFMGLLQRRSLKTLQQDFRKLLAADLAMKTGTDAATALQQLVVGLCA